MNLGVLDTILGIQDINKGIIVEGQSFYSVSLLLLRVGSLALHLTVITTETLNLKSSCVCKNVGSVR